MKIKGAIFDMDGTLIDSLSFWNHFWKNIGKRYMNDPDFQACETVDKAIRTMVYADAMIYVKEYYNIAAGNAEFLHFAESELLDFYRDVATVKDGAIALLEHLKQMGIPICLASATAMKGLRFVLDCHGLTKYFDTVLSCADIGVGKDKPDIYLMALDAMSLSASEVCVFEDSYVALETAKAAGFQTVGIYDRCNFEQERLRNASDIYLDKTQPLSALIPLINR